jgi:hypothetical protein
MMESSSFVVECMADRSFFSARADSSMSVDGRIPFRLMTVPLMSNERRKGHANHRPTIPRSARRSADALSAGRLGRTLGSARILLFQFVAGFRRA